MWLSDTSIKKPVTTILFTVGIMVFGFFAFQNMGVDLFPEIDFPTVTVSAVLPGADPEIMDSDVTDVLEEQINTIQGVKSIQSVSREGRSTITVEFVLSKNVDVAAQEVRDKINLAQRNLPDELDPPIIDKVDISSQPILWIALTSDGDYRRMAQYADEIIRVRIESTPGVGSCQMGGFRDREIKILLDSYALQARNLTPRDVSQAIQNKHIELPSGRIEQIDREYVIKVKGEYTTAEELQNLVVVDNDGAIVYLKDVARVVDGSQDTRSMARFNGVPAVGMGIRKQSGTNTVAVAHAVKDVVAQLAKEVPEGLNLSIAFDSSRFIESSMGDVRFDLFLGAILTSFVMLVFLRSIRLTLISIISIPVSIISCFIAMYAMGFTVNNMTMLAMSLAIGIVIDDAIVVLENIFRHVETFGEKAMEASRKGTSEVGLAVISASSAIVALFVPIAFMKGVIGRFFFQFGLSVAVAILISMVVSFTLIPMLCSRLLKHNTQHGPIFRMFERLFKGLERRYAALLDVALRFRWTTLFIALLCFAGGMALIPFVKKEFMVQPDESRFMLRAEFPTGTSITGTDIGMRKIERAVYSQPEVLSAFSVTGMRGDVNNGMMMINLLRSGERKLSQAEFMAQLRKVLKDVVPDARISADAVSPMGGGQRNVDVQYVLLGPELKDLERVSNAMIAGMKQTPGFVDVDNDLRLNKPEVSVDIDRDLADDLGIDIKNIAENFNILFGGMDAAKFKAGGNRYNIRLRADPQQRKEAEDLYDVMLRSPGGDMIQTPNLIKAKKGLGPNSINRFQRRRSVTIFANLDGLPLGKALETMDVLSKQNVPDDPGWSHKLTGRSEMFAESFQYLVYALLMSLLVIYIILGSQFESFMHPFTIMMAVPLAVVGGVGLLVLTGKTLDVFSFIGFIMLVGIVTRNSILLVDFTNQQRAQGVEREKALRMAGPVRLRPILMTALTVVAAITPMAIALSEGGEQRAPMGIAVFGGMFTSTILTLVVIPCVYSVVDDFASYFRRLFGMGRAQE